MSFDIRPLRPSTGGGSSTPPEPLTSVSLAVPFGQTQDRGVVTYLPQAPGTLQVYPDSGTWPVAGGISFELTLDGQPVTVTVAAGSYANATELAAALSVTGDSVPQPTISEGGLDLLFIDPNTAATRRMAGLPWDLYGELRVQGFDGYPAGLSTSPDSNLPAVADLLTRLAALEASAGPSEQMVFRGNFDPSETYTRAGDLVVYDAKSFVVTDPAAVQAAQPPLALPVAPYPGEMMTTDPDGFWRCNDASGATGLVDASGHGLTAYASSPVSSQPGLTAEPGALGVYFSPVDNFATAASPQLAAGSAFSFSMLLSVGSRNGGAFGIARGRRSDWASYWTLEFLDDYRLRFSVNGRDASNSGAGGDAWVGSLPGTGGNRLVVTFDSGRVRAYINGVPTADTTIAPVRVLGPDILQFGGNIGGTAGGGVAGTLDEVAYWTRALTEAEALALNTAALDPHTSTQHLNPGWVQLP